MGGSGFEVKTVWCIFGLVENVCDRSNKFVVSELIKKLKSLTKEEDIFKFLESD